MPDLDALRDHVQAILNNGQSVEDVIAFLRSEGCSKTDCIWMLEDHAGLSHAEAKQVVHVSPTWVDRREADEQLHEQLEQELRRSATEYPPAKFKLP